MERSSEEPLHRLNPFRRNTRGMIAVMVAIGGLMFLVGLVLLLVGAFILGVTTGAFGFAFVPLLWILSIADLLVVVGLVVAVLGWYL